MPRPGKGLPSDVRLVALPVEPVLDQPEVEVHSAIRAAIELKAPATLGWKPVAWHGLGCRRGQLHACADNRGLWRALWIRELR